MAAGLTHPQGLGLQRAMSYCSVWANLRIRDRIHLSVRRFKCSHKLLAVAFSCTEVRTGEEREHALWSIIISVSLEIKDISSSVSWLLVLTLVQLEPSRDLSWWTSVWRSLWWAFHVYDSLESWLQLQTSLRTWTIVFYFSSPERWL